MYFYLALILPLKGVGIYFHTAVDVSFVGLPVLFLFCMLETGKRTFHTNRSRNLGIFIELPLKKKGYTSRYCTSFQKLLFVPSFRMFIICPGSFQGGMSLFLLGGLVGYTTFSPPCFEVGSEGQWDALAPCSVAEIQTHIPSDRSPHSICLFSGYPSLNICHHCVIVFFGSGFRLRQHRLPKTVLSSFQLNLTSFEPPPIFWP